MEYGNDRKEPAGEPEIGGFLYTMSEGGGAWRERERKVVKIKKMVFRGRSAKYKSEVIFAHGR